MPEPPEPHQARPAPPPAERRNLYRILHVQPEAPAEIIKASYRALMSSLRAHPDLGGDPARAAQINAAYAVLGDPVQRAAYDRSLRRPRGAPPGSGESPIDAAPRCPFCLSAAPPGTPRDGHCGGCGAPLAPAPAPAQVPGELLGRRRGARVAREIDARLRRPGQADATTAVLRDVSVTGLSLACLPAIEAGAVIRVTTATFDAVARVVACRRAGPAHVVHARLLTLQLAAPVPAKRTPAA